MMKDIFLKACNKENYDQIPVWFMRQAGRYMASYRKLREKYDFMQIAKTPQLSSQVALSAVKELGVDAAIIFSDLILPVEAMGAKVRIEERRGPIVEHVVRSMRDVESLRVVDPSKELNCVLEGIDLTLGGLEEGIPLIGFSGAPFTLATYLVEGTHTRDLTNVKRLMYENPDVWHELMGKLTEMTVANLRSQIQAGVHAVQLFDTWAECLSPTDYKEYVFEYSRKVFRGIEGERVPRLHYARGGANLLKLLHETGGDILSVDWRTDIDEVWKLLGNGVAVQGNLEPAVLFSSIPNIEARVSDILRIAEGRAGYIFNLGGGILPETPVENVKHVVDYVHNWRRSS
ncbi:MAG: uroporphyrinogen decarboxylase [Thaumarchaeota archaeon]|nr:uroporphyrinogen decarboxylase [Nitrososphaerota archaeon]